MSRIDRYPSSCTPSKAPAGLREVFCPELVIFPKTGVQIGNTGGFLLPSTSGRGGHKKRWPVPEPLQLFRESLPLPCFPCASFLFKSGLYSPSIAVSASKAAPCLPSRWPFRHAPRCGVERSEYSERESLSWGAGKGRGSLFILTGISLIPSFIEYRVTVLSGAFPSLLGIVWRVSAAFLGDAVLNGTVRGMLWRACPSSKGKNHPSSPIVSRRAPSSLPRILRAAPGWCPAISANSLGWTSPIGRKEPSPPYWRSNAPADGVEPFRSPGHLVSAYSV